MRSLFLIVLMFSSAAYGQKVNVSKIGNSIGLTLEGKKYCKYMYIQDKNPSCHNVVYYIPVYSCDEKELKKIPQLKYREELKNMQILLDSASQQIGLQICMFKLDISPYDDLLSQLIDIFANSEKWKEHLAFNKINHENPNLHYDAKLVVDILNEHHFFTATDSLLAKYGARIGTFHAPEEKQQLVSESELIRLKKNKDLIIPLPDPIWIQLNQYK